jgi:hypothetical protein
VGVTQSGPAVPVRITGLLLFYNVSDYLAITAFSVDVGKIAKIARR